MAGKLEPYLLIAAGGFAGACVRYALGDAVPGMYGILIVNILGCYLLGFLMYESIYIGAFDPKMRMLCGSGFIGALTTFSTFSLQTFEASPLPAMLNIAASLALGFIAVYLGRATAAALGGKSWRR